MLKRHGGYLGPDDIRRVMNEERKRTLQELQDVLENRTDMLDGVKALTWRTFQMGMAQVGHLERPDPEIPF
jgi:hypothetical protein